MRLGLFMMPLHKVGRDYSWMFQQDYDAILHADRLGFDEVFVGEHYTAQVEPIPNPLQFMSALIPVTKNITFGTGVLNLPQHHPARIAGDAAQFDHMSRGRFIMGIGPGGLATDFELFDTVDRDRSRMMVECIDMVLKIWESDQPYVFEGEFWKFKVRDLVMADLGIGPMLKPYQRPHPPMVVSAMSPSSGTARLAGTRGWGVISANFNPTVHNKSQWDAYCAGAEKAGRRPERKDWRIARSILLTESEAEAEDYLADPDNTVRDYFRYLRENLTRNNMIKIFKPDQSMSDEEITDDFCVESMAIVGPPKRVVERLVALLDEVGPFGGLCMAFHEWDREPLWRRSMELLATEVMPELNRAAAGRRAAE
jgi:alkanesulfonate monooxygenase SsuD/methylene tetrahydromethanopterin reductase-like flavin-dependent oxidoreductase (luciferase family)